MDERILKFRVGILVVISMLILGILILTISGKPFFGTSYQLSGTTKNASGISSGTPIKKFGLPIGRVTKVAPSPNGKEVTVWMSIQETDSNGLKQTIDTSTEMAVIGSESILGDVVINIEPAKKNENKSQVESEIIITKSNPIEAVLGEQGSNLMSELESLLKPNPDVKTNFGDTVAEIKSAAGA
ncbi:MlaD family protein, partial [Mariniblastus sp.]|nr:MlaD family protein [Mariniblastus sp.]